MIDHDFSKEWEVFLVGYRDSKITSLRDMVEFNKQNAMIWMSSWAR